MAIVAFESLTRKERSNMFSTVSQKESGLTTRDMRSRPGAFLAPSVAGSTPADRIFDIMTSLSFWSRRFVASSCCAAPSLKPLVVSYWVSSSPSSTTFLRRCAAFFSFSGFWSGPQRNDASGTARKRPAHCAPRATQSMSPPALVKSCDSALPMSAALYCDTFFASLPARFIAASESCTRMSPSLTISRLKRTFLKRLLLLFRSSSKASWSRSCRSTLRSPMRS
mmetsp:Transcript_29457/g.95450  ORF Transcript_29457/g.95450 Transcript_29457/m.95450 type:complete len:224 (+) Transcript_29457:74-745(+)